MTISDVTSAGCGMVREGRNLYHTRGSGGAVQGGPGYSNGRAGCGEPDLLLRWGHRKRLRWCTKIQRGRGDEAPPLPAATSSRAYRHVVRPYSGHPTAAAAAVQTRRRSSPPSGHLSQRSSEAATGAMRIGDGQQQINGGRASPEGGAAPAAAVTNGDLDNRQHGGGSGGERSSSSGDGATWPRFEIALTNEEEDDFLMFKGSRLPLRPKKRTKIMQRTLNHTYNHGNTILGHPRESSTSIQQMSRRAQRWLINLATAGEPRSMALRPDAGEIRGQGDEGLQEEAKGIESHGRKHREWRFGGEDAGELKPLMSSPPRCKYYPEKKKKKKKTKMMSNAVQQSLR